MTHDVIPASPDIDPTKVEFRLKVTFVLRATLDDPDHWRQIDAYDGSKAEIEAMLTGVLEAPEFRKVGPNHDLMTVTVRSERDITMLMTAASELIMSESWFVEIHAVGHEPYSVRHRTGGPSYTGKINHLGQTLARPRHTFCLWGEEVTRRDHAKLVKDGTAFSPILFEQWHAARDAK